MKLTTTFISALFAFFLLACSGNDTNTENNTPQSPSGVPPATTQPSTSTQQSPANTTTATGGVFHYICPNNCAGSGGNVKGSCPTCGTQYVHNAAYHNQGTQTTTPTNQVSPIFKQNQQTPAQTTTPAPAQNAAGVYHYICSNGCSGGSGTAGACATCGGALTHNQAYHN